MFSSYCSETNYNPIVQSWSMECGADCGWFVGRNWEMVDACRNAYLSETFVSG